LKCEAKEGGIAEEEMESIEVVMKQVIVEHQMNEG